MKEIIEGKVGYAKNGEILKYPAVTSCLTVTCVLVDGGKWGAHMSLFQCGDGLPHHVLLQTLRTEMSTAKDLDNVRKVMVVGALGFWPPNLKPGTSEEALRALEDKKKTNEILKDKLGLKKLDVSRGDQFEYKNSNVGDVEISAGSAASEIRVQKSAEEK